MRKRLFFAAKINVHANIFSQDLMEIIIKHIPRVILESKTIQHNSWNWAFTDVEERFINGKRTIIGNVTKSKHITQKVKIGSKTVRKKTDDEIAHTAFFVYDPESEILAHEKTGSIDAFEFRQLFTKLLSSDPLVGDVVINPIPVPQKIRAEFLAIEKVTKVEFHLIHPNPGKKEFNLYQEIISDVGIKELDIQMGNKSGIEVKEFDSSNGEIKFKNSIESGIALVESGYGSIDVRGYNESVVPGKRKDRIQKNKKRYSSSMSVRQLNILEYDQDTLVGRLLSFITSSKNKTKNGSDDLGI